VGGRSRQSVTSDEPFQPLAPGSSAAAIHTGAVELPPPPDRSFASDNAAGAHPAVLDAVARANHGHALAYGDDRWTRQCEDAFRELFGDVTTLLTFNGTGANVLALATMLGPVDAVVCTVGAHVAYDEAGATERILGAKLIDLPTADGKLRPEQLDDVAHLRGSPHHAQPAVVSITQSTELGTVYTADEVAALCDAAHRLGMAVHIDGARIANAAAALGGDVAALRSFTVDAGVDVLTFGGTKNGLLGGEAVVFLRSDLAPRAPYLRKQVTQLASKMRFVAAQFLAVLSDGLWLELAGHANAMATRLHAATAPLPGVDHDAPPQVNSLFPTLTPELARTLQKWSFFWPWEPSRQQFRWMTAWDTTDDDVTRFAAGVAAAAGTPTPSPA
jgi:threonine aldolase